LLALACAQQPVPAAAPAAKETAKPAAPAAAPQPAAKEAAAKPAGIAKPGAYPRRAVSVIVCFGAGGGSDLAIRALQPSLEKLMGVPITVVNKPGGGGLSCLPDFATAPPDGYTLLFHSDTLVSTYVEGKSNLHPLNDIVPLIITNIVPSQLYINPKDERFLTNGKPDFNKLVQYAKANPGQLTVANVGGALVPLLALGLPGGALTAIMYGAFTIHGLEPGALVLVNARDLVWVLFASVFWASALIFALGFVETKSVVNLLRIPFGVLGPLIIVLSLIGAYALRNSILDVWVMLVAGIFAYLLRRAGSSIPALIVAVILGELGESAFAKAMVILDYRPLGFLQNPLAAVLLLLGVATIALNIIRRPKLNVASD
jgi:hypothetical protein